MKTAPRAIVPLLALAFAAALSRGQDSSMRSDPSMRVVLGGHEGPTADGRSADRGAGNRLQPAMETESAAFLGVETAPVTETLTDQLNLPRGFGLVVAHVAPESPAAAALKPHDILLKLDDQQLVDSRQFAVLIRNHKDGDEVTLTYLRGGKEATVKAKLVLRLVPKLAADPFGGPGWSNDLGPERIQGMLSMMSPRQVEVRRAEGDGEPEFRIFKMNTGNSHVSFTDRLGALELTVVDGKQTLVAKDAKGEQLFSGPVDTPGQRKALPAAVRERFDRLEGQIKSDLGYRIDGDFKGSDPNADPAPPLSSMRQAPRGVPAPPLTLI